MKISLREIQLSKLDNESLTLVAKYVRLLKSVEGIGLKMQDEDVLIKISRSARNTNNEELLTLYREMKEKIKRGVFESLST